MAIMHDVVLPKKRRRRRDKGCPLRRDKTKKNCHLSNLPSSLRKNPEANLPEKKEMTKKIIFLSWTWEDNPEHH